MGKFVFSNLKGYKLKWIRSDIIAALIVTAIAIPQSLGYAVIVGLPVQTGLYCAILAPIIFALFASSRRLVVGADSATAILVASGATAIALVGSSEYTQAVALLGLLTGVILLLMAIFRFGFLADLISQTVLIGFLAGVGLQLIIGQLPVMLGMHAQGTLIDKIIFLGTNLSHIEIAPTIVALAVIVIITLGSKFRFPGALIALLFAIVATKLFNLPTFGIAVVGAVPQGLPSFSLPALNLNMLIALLPAAFSIAIVILSQSLAVIRSSAAKHEEKVKDNQDLTALGFANLASAVTGGFAINGSPPRTSAGEMAGGRSQLVNIIMAILIAITLLVATGLFAYVPTASLAAVVFMIGLHLIKIKEFHKIWAVRKSEFAIAVIALICVALFGVQNGIMIAVVLSLIERLRRQYHPHDEILLKDQEYSEWTALRLGEGKKHRLHEAPAGLLVYRFNEAIFFENSTYFLERATHVVKHAKDPVKMFVLDASAITDIDYTAVQTLIRLAGQLHADDIQFGIAHVSPRLHYLLKRYELIDILTIFPSLRSAIKSYTRRHITSADRVKSLKLSPKDYVVIGGGVLELLGIRDTVETDIVVNEKTYNKLNSHNWKEYVQDSGKKILSRRGYKIMTEWVGKDLAYLQKSAIRIDGIPVMGLEDLIACKSQLGRKKDLEDIENITKYMKKDQPEKASVIKLAPALARS
jgi:sulfate permease, SulP family